MTASVAPSRALRALARWYGVQTDYRDASGVRRRASADGLVAALGALGAAIEDPGDARQAVEYRRAELRRRVAAPVAVAWDGGADPLRLRLPGRRALSGVRAALELEGGDVLDWHPDLGPAARGRGDGVESRIELPPDLPAGVHRLELRFRTGEEAVVHVVSAPRVGWREPTEAGRWGAFLPLYALHTERSWGIGDFGDLGDLAEWVGRAGGAAVGTLPLLATFLDDPFEPSPYSPASRLFWSELFVEVLEAPGAGEAGALAEVTDAPDFQATLAALRQGRLIDYRRAAALKRRALEAVASTVMGGDGRPGGLRAFLDERPEALEYARFRAATERMGGWRGWPEPLRSGRLDHADVHPASLDYHLYVQWAAHEQLGRAARRGADAGAGLYLDLPLGVHRDGYDLWRERDLFVEGASAGAPPDPLFQGGQDWGFPPPHPERMRRTGYRYLRACLAQHMRFAGWLRLDHVMALHRLYWIPPGCSAREGVYVRYPAEELYALLSLESHRHRCELVGEDLGTVPPSVRRSMARHGVRRMYVVQYEADPGAERPLRGVPDGAVASVNTHDMPTFAGFWRGADIEDRRDLGLLDTAALERERSARQHLRETLARAAGVPAEGEPMAVLRGLLEHLAGAPDALVLVALEDLWLEPEPQNVPGTWRERPNWRRKAKHPLERIRHMSGVVETLERIRRKQRGERQDGG